MPGHTDNSIVIHAPMDLVWEMTNDLESWTTLFTEYEGVELLGRDGATVRFRLTTRPDENGNSWTWVSERTPDPETRTVTARRIETGPFHHMDIYWEFTPAEGGTGVRMRWVQNFSMKPDAPVDDPAAERYLNQRSAAEMAHIKRMVEDRARAAAGPGTDGRPVAATGDGHGRR